MKFKSSDTVSVYVPNLGIHPIFFAKKSNELQVSNSELFSVSLVWKTLCLCQTCLYSQMVAVLLDQGGKDMSMS